MLVLGQDVLETLLQGACREAKAVFNSDGIVFFDRDRQHRDVSAEGIWYADDYKGNAMAAMVRPGAFEIRYHAAFRDQQVAQIVRDLSLRSGLECLASWQVTYQGRLLTAWLRTRDTSDDGTG